MVGSLSSVIGQHNSATNIHQELNIHPIPRETPKNSTASGYEKTINSFSVGFNESEFTSFMQGADCFQINSLEVITAFGDSQVGTFTGGVSGASLEIDEGIILTTGSVVESFTTNSSATTSLGGTTANTISDPELDALVTNGQGTFDEAIMIIDFNVSQYVEGFQIPFQFASEEYNESVCSQFDDLFGIYLSGTGLNGQIPLSLIPGTNETISVNTINNGSCGNAGTGQAANLSNSNLFIDNSSAPFPIEMEYDGFTTKIIGTQNGLHTGNYQLKIVIADLNDSSYDSAVILGSMQASIDGVAVSCDCINDPLADLSGDCDGDGVLNGDETSAEAALQACNPNPLAVPLGDCDGDGILNQDELSIEDALDPCKPNLNALNIGDCDGYTNQEEIDGICGFIGDPTDINSPFAFQETTNSGVSDDQIFMLSGQTSSTNLLEGRHVHLTIKAGHTLTLDADISIRDLVLEEFATLDLNGFTIVISGDLTLDGDLVHNLGHLHMRDDCEPRNIYANKTHDIHELTIQNEFGVTLHTDMNVSGPIHPEDGVFDLNNQEVILTSALINGDVKTGSISEIKTNADVIGEITMQRFVQSTEDGYRLIGSPIKDLTVADLNDDFVTTGFPGSDYPNHYFTNVKYYDETNRLSSGEMTEGFTDVSSVTQNLLEYQGYWAYFPPSNISPVLDSKGEFHKGDVTIPLSVTPLGATSADDGWHCIINPYPSAIDLDSPCIEFNNVGTAVYILDHTSGGTWQGEYAVYNNGVGINGGDNVVASYQAFMVQATGPGAYLKFNECAKTDEQGVFFRSALQKNLIRLSVSQDSTEYESVIAFDAEASSDFDTNFDARKITTTTFSLFSVMGTDTLAINTVPPQFEDDISLVVNTPLAGEYTLNVKEFLGLQDNVCLTITDLETQQTWQIEPGLNIPFITAYDGYNDVRFVINRSRIGEIEITHPECHDVNTGEIHFELNSTNSAEFNWFDQSGSLVKTETGLTASADRLSPGIYNLEYNSTSDFCANGNISIEILEPKEQLVHLTSTPDYCSNSEGKIQIEVEAAENWSATLFRDNQALQSENSSEIIEFNDLSGGIYTVVIESNCIYSEHVLDISDKDQVIAYFMTPDEVIIQNSTTPLEVESLSENVEENHWYLDSDYLGGNNIIWLTFNQPGDHTLTLNSTNEKCDDSFSKQIFVSTASIIAENLEQDFLVINKTESIEINLLNDRNLQLEINLYDTNGRLIYKESNISASTVSINKSDLSTGVYFLEIRNKESVLLTKKILK